MLKSKDNLASSQSYTDFDQQQRKQILNIIFPHKINKQQQVKQKLYNNLQQYYNPKQHSQQLINHAYHNHNYECVKIYRQFIKNKHKQITEPRISLYYQNQSFIDLLILGQYRSNPSQFPIRHIESIAQSLYEQLDRIFLQYGFIPNLQRFLTFYPQYLIKQRIVQRQLFQNSKIDQQTTYFLALCAAMENGCPYMINRMIIKFLSKGGKIQWIKNKKYPIKISKVLLLNRILARCIWDIQSEVFQEIIEDGYWNINQIALIIQIFSYVHSLCVITLALGLQPQQRNSIFSTQKIQQYLKTYQQQSVQSLVNIKKTPLKQILPTLMTLLQQMRNSSQVIQSKLNPKKSFRKQRNSQQLDKDNKDKDNIPIQLYMKQIGNQLTQQKIVIKIMKQIYILPEYTPIQKRRDTKFNQFTCVDFNFQIKSFPRLLSMSTVTESTKKIRAWIKQAQQMGIQNFGNQFISSTKQLRKAQRYYAQNLCGFSHPQYDYKKFMTNILTIPLKFYIRILMLSPLHMKRQIIDEICHQKGRIQLFDLGHTAILIASAKCKLSLTLSTYYFDN